MVLVRYQWNIMLSLLISKLYNVKVHKYLQNKNSKKTFKILLIQFYFFKICYPLKITYATQQMRFTLFEKIIMYYPL